MGHGPSAHPAALSHDKLPFEKCPPGPLAALLEVKNGGVETERRWKGKGRRTEEGTGRRGEEKKCKREKGKGEKEGAICLPAFSSTDPGYDPEVCFVEMVRERNAFCSSKLYEKPKYLETNQLIKIPYTFIPSLNLFTLVLHVYV